MPESRQPVLFIPHGGGPWPFVELPAFEPDEVASLATFLRQLPDALPPPRAVVVISAHWQAPVATVMNAPRPPLFYDYYGFPPESYRIEWPAPGAPALADRVQALLAQAGLDSATDSRRGFDHGTFIPLKLMYPQADVPVLQLSMLDRPDPAAHRALGAALAPLRDEGVLIIGSGMSYHDIRGFFVRNGRLPSEAFDAWLQQAACAEPAERARRLDAWAQAPAARQAHPHPDHLLPLMVAAGAAGEDRGRCIYSDLFGDARISAFRFG